MNVPCEIKKRYHATNLGNYRIKVLNTIMDTQNA
jgi:hypothetical protein